jgi:cell division protein FtsB
MLRAGQLAPIPEALQGQEIKFEYNSPVKKIRQQVDAAAAKKWAEEIIILAQSKPEVLDLINADALARFSAEASNIPKDIVNSAEVVQQLQEQRAEAQAAAAEAEQEQMQMQMLKDGSDAAEKLTRHDQPEAEA